MTDHHHITFSVSPFPPGDILTRFKYSTPYHYTTTMNTHKQTAALSYLDLGYYKIILHGNKLQWGVHTWCNINTDPSF